MDRDGPTMAPNSLTAEQAHHGAQAWFKLCCRHPDILSNFYVVKILGVGSLRSGLSRAGFSQGLSLWFAGSHLPCVLTWSSFCVQISVSYKDTSHTGLEPTLMDSFYLQEDPISK